MRTTTLSTSEQRVLTMELARADTLRDIIHALGVQCPQCNAAAAHGCNTEEHAIVIHAARIARAHQSVTITVGQPIETGDGA